MLATFILNPFTVIKQSASSVTYTHALISILLFALYIAKLIAKIEPLFILSIAALIVIGLFVSCALIDGLAQLFSKSSQFILVFRLMSCTLGLWILISPLAQLQTVLSSTIISLGYLVFYLFFYSVQLFVLKTVYSINSLKAVALICVPGSLLVLSLVLTVLSII